MSGIINVLILIVGFFFLIKGADIFVDGSSKIARKIGIPSVIVGLTIVSLGTSAPELAVSLISSIEGNNGIAVGNVLGSNIFNTLVVLGGTSLAMPLIIKKKLVGKDYLVNILVIILLYVLTFGFMFSGKDGFLSRTDGIILLVCCLAYLLFLIFSTLKNKKSTSITLGEKKELSSIKVLPNLFFVILGVIGIVFGGKLVVDSATNIALSVGMSEKLVGLTIVAIGTSLPELVTSIVAALKGETEIAIGNVLGSNIFNILLILGLSSAISPIAVAGNLFVDIIFLFVVTLIIGVLIFANKKTDIKTLNRSEGILLVLFFVAYLAFIIIRN